MYPKPSCVPLISSNRNFSAWNFTSNYGHYFQLLSCIFYLFPAPYFWNCSVSGNLIALAVWCGCGCVWFPGVTCCLQVTRLQGFRLICSASLGMQLYANFPVWTKQSQVTTKIFSLLDTVGGSFWAGLGEKGRISVCCCFLFLLSSGRWSFFSWDRTMMLEMQLCHVIISHF